MTTFNTSGESTLPAHLKALQKKGYEKPEQNEGVVVDKSKGSTTETPQSPQASESLGFPYIPSGEADNKTAPEAKPEEQPQMMTSSSVIHQDTLAQAQKIVEEGLNGKGIPNDTTLAQATWKAAQLNASATILAAERAAQATLQLAALAGNPSGAVNVTSTGGGPHLHAHFEASANVLGALYQGGNDNSVRETNVTVGSNNRGDVTVDTGNKTSYTLFNFAQPTEQELKNLPASFSQIGGSAILDKYCKDRIKDPNTTDILFPIDLATLTAEGSYEKDQPAAWGINSQLNIKRNTTTQMDSFNALALHTAYQEVSQSRTKIDKSLSKDFPEYVNRNGTYTQAAKDLFKTVTEGCRPFDKDGTQCLKLPRGSESPWGNSYLMAKLGKQNRELSHAFNFLKHVFLHNYQKADKHGTLQDTTGEEKQQHLDDFDFYLSLHGQTEISQPKFSEYKKRLAENLDLEAITKYVGSIYKQHLKGAQHTRPRFPIISDRTTATALTNIDIIADALEKTHGKNIANQFRKDAYPVGGDVKSQDEQAYHTLTDSSGTKRRHRPVADWSPEFRPSENGDGKGVSVPQNQKNDRDFILTDAGKLGKPLISGWIKEAFKGVLTREGKNPQSANAHMAICVFDPKGSAKDEGRGIREDDSRDFYYNVAEAAQELERARNNPSQGIQWKNLFRFGRSKKRQPPPVEV